MKKTILFKSFLIALVALMLPSQSMAYDFKVDGLCYNINSDGTSVALTYEFAQDSGSGYSTIGGDVVIPERVTYNGNEYLVTSIGDDAFRKCANLTSVSIPNSVTKIGNFAFIFCSKLVSISLPNSAVEIGRSCFKGCYDLTSATLGNSLTSIGDYAFESCTSLVNVDIPNTVTSIGINAFKNCTGITTVTLGESVSTVGETIFLNCSSLTTVYWNAKNCSNFTSTATSQPFNGLTSISTLIFGNSVESIPRYICSNLSNLTSVTIGSSVTSIGSNAFSGCGSIASVVWNAKDCDNSLSCPFSSSASTISSFTFGPQVEKIPSSICEGLTRLTGNLDIPNNVTTIGLSAFSGCTGFTSVTIGKSVKTIRNTAFENCTGLNKVTWNATQCNDFTPSSSADITYNSPFHQLTNIKTFVVGNDVLKIPAYVCVLLSGLQSLTIGSSVTSIGKRAFYKCNKLSGTLNIPNSVTTIADEAFRSCTSLKAVTIGYSLESVGNSVFNECTNITTITIKASNVLSLGDGSFKSLSKLIDLYCYMSYPSIATLGGGSVFAGSQSACTLHVPIGASSRYRALDQWKDFYQIVEDIVLATSISLNNTSICLEVGETSTLVATLLPSNTTTNNIIWKSSNTAIATVDQNGMVTAVAEGTTTITASTTDGSNLSTSCEVTVTQPDVPSAYEFIAEKSITTIAHQATPIVFSLKNPADIKGIEFDIATSTWLNATGTVTVKTGTAEPSSVDFVSQPVFTLTERFIGEMDETKWMYLFEQTVLIEYPNMLNGAETEKGLYGTVAIHMGEEVQTEEDFVVKEYLEAGEGELFAINLYPLISGDHSINISNIKLTLVDGTEVELDPFTINVKANRVPGDLNDDGVVDENDVPGGAKKYYNLAIDAGNIVTGEINTVTLMPISLHNTGEITAFSCTITVPAEIELVDDINSFVVAGERGENFTFNATQNQNGTITINGTAATPLEAGDGVVLKLKVKSSWQRTNTIPVTNITITTASGTVEQLPNSVTKLMLTGTRGDMNGDGRVDLSDALYIINMATGLAQ